MAKNPSFGQKKAKKPKKQSKQSKDVRYAFHLAYKAGQHPRQTGMDINFGASSGS
jgi:hypothetical protein